MKGRTLGLVSVVGMLLSGMSAYFLTPPGGVAAADDWSGDRRSTSRESSEDEREEPAGSPHATFTTGTTLGLEGRVGHDRLLRGPGGETFLMLEVTADSTKNATTRSAPVNLGLVIDRSGSMKGTRLRNAQQGAMAAIDRLQDGDVVTVAAFDTQTSIVVPPTTIDFASRERVRAAVLGIQLGGDTCISCGVGDAMREMERTSGKVNRMIVLSDGDANQGVRDAFGFRALGRSAKDRGVSITTIGVSLQYNQELLSAISQDSDGNHYFVENEAGLSRVFESEAASLKRSVATDAVATVTLAPGVTVEQVFDRAFTRSGDRLTFALGSFSAGEKKTVLVKVRFDGEAARRGADDAEIAEVELSYDDLSSGRRVSDHGTLEVALTDDRTDVPPLDPVVLGRVQRSETASAVREANELFAGGKADLARERLLGQRKQVAASRGKARDLASPFDAPDVDKDFARQDKVLQEAEGSFAPPPSGAAAPSSTSRAVKRNTELSHPLGF